MKKSLILVFFLCPFIMLSQEAVKDSYSYVKVYEVEGKSQDQIHSTILEWIGKNFKSPQEVIQFNDKNKIIIDRKFKMSPKLIQTSQKTTSNYKVSSTMVFLIKENKFRLEMQLKDSYVFDGKKRDPNTTWEIASNQINENYVGNLLMTAFLNVKQYRTFSFGGGLNRPPSDLQGDAKEKRAVRYVDKEIKKGLYVQRVKKVAQSLNDEILSVFNSIEEFFKDSPNNDDW